MGTTNIVEVKFEADCYGGFSLQSRKLRIKMQRHTGQSRTELRHEYFFKKHKSGRMFIAMKSSNCFDIISRTVEKQKIDRGKSTYKTTNSVPLNYGFPIICIG